MGGGVNEAARPPSALLRPVSVASLLDPFSLTPHSHSLLTFLRGPFFVCFWGIKPSDVKTLIPYKNFGDGWGGYVGSLPLYCPSGLSFHKVSLFLLILTVSSALINPWRAYSLMLPLSFNAPLQATAVS